MLPPLASRVVCVFALARVPPLMLMLRNICVLGLLASRWVGLFVLVLAARLDARFGAHTCHPCFMIACLCSSVCSET